MSTTFCSVVKESCEKLGLKSIEFKDLAPRQKPHLQTRVQAEFLQVMQAAIPPILLRSGEAKTIEDAKEIFAAGIQKQTEEKFAKGEVPTYPIVSVVARMPA
jgi:flagellar biosynthesis/type III secretory pathway protein FliH